MGSDSPNDQLAKQKMTKKRPVERQKMRPWLLDMLGNGNVGGLEWYDKDKGLFKILWKHGSRHGWNTKKDANLFEKYAIHTGRFDPQHPNPKKWKANFRCALHSLQNVTEVKSLGESKGANAYRVYQFLPEDATKAKSDEEISKRSNKIKRKKSQRKVKNVDIDSGEEDGTEQRQFVTSPDNVPPSTSVETGQAKENIDHFIKPEVTRCCFPNHMSGSTVTLNHRKRPASQLQPKVADHIPQPAIILEDDVSKITSSMEETEPKRRKTEYESDPFYHSMVPSASSSSMTSHSLISEEWSSEVSYSSDCPSSPEEAEADITTSIDGGFPVITNLVVAPYAHADECWIAAEESVETSHDLDSQ